MVKKVGYIFDEKLKLECDRLPAVKNRVTIFRLILLVYRFFKFAFYLQASMVHDLITSYKLLNGENVSVIESKPATEDELKYFHATSYLDFLKNANDSDDLSLFDDEQVEFGLGYDCQLLPKTYDLIKTIAGGSLTAAKLLNRGDCNVVINWFGGWHHAQRYFFFIIPRSALYFNNFRDEAEGFCYVNDIVIAIQELTKNFGKILYIDFDIHHGKQIEHNFHETAI